MMNTGYLFLYIATVAALFSIGTTTLKRQFYRKSAFILFFISSVCVTSALALLEYYLISDTFAYAYVAEHTAKDLPVHYKIAALWSGQEGSLMLWTCCYVPLIFFFFRRKEPLISTTLLIIYTSFLLIITFFANPFTPATQMLPDGNGLHPLLMNIWMISHPPLLFFGYALSSVPFAHSIKAVVNRDFANWTRPAYPWVVAAVVLIGMGIFTGGRWAYTVLNWGGFWSWDPVENASLLPWIISIVLLHGMLLQKKGRRFQKTNIFLAYLLFLLTIYSTFLTRSGLLADFSVHSFMTSSAAIPLFFLLVLIVLSGCVLALRIVRIEQSLPTEQALFSPANSLFIMLYGMGGLLLYACIIAIATSMPLLTRAILPMTFIVREDFYAVLTLPFGFFFLLTIIFSCYAHFFSRNYWKVTSVLVPLALLCTALIYREQGIHVPGFALSSAALLLFFFICYDSLPGRHSSRSLPGSIAHAGFAIMVFGMVSHAFFSTTQSIECTRNIPVSFKEYTLTFMKKTPAPQSRLCFFLASPAGESMISLPYYRDPQTASLYREPYIIHDLMYDIYIAPLEFTNGHDSSGLFSLAKGGSTVCDGTSFTLLDYHISSSQPIAFVTTLRASMKGITRTLHPKIIINDHGDATHQEALLPNTGQRLFIKTVDRQRQAIVFQLQPSLSGVIPADRVTLSIAWKKLIILVWMGTLLIIAGGLAACINSMRKSRS